MRALKFRVWNKDEGAMYDVRGFEFSDGISKVIVEKDDELIELLPEEVKIMQFTGILDSDGTEIFEGDIVKVLGMDNQLFGYIWHNGFYHTINLHNVAGTDNWPIFKQENIIPLDVIGNMWENSNLLKP